MVEEALRKDLLTTFEYAHHREDWVTPLAEALAGVTLEEATWRPAPDAKCIWEIVLHMAVWTENMAERLTGDPLAHPADGPWPALPSAATRAAWEASGRRLDAALTLLRRTLRDVPFSTLTSRPFPDGSLLDDVLCRYAHNAYHIGQITKLRECFGGRS